MPFPVEAQLLEFKAGRLGNRAPETIRQGKTSDGARSFFLVSRSRQHVHLRHDPPALVHVYLAKLDVSEAQKSTSGKRRREPAGVVSQVERKEMRGRRAALVLDGGSVERRESAAAALLWTLPCRRFDQYSVQIPRNSPFRKLLNVRFCVTYTKYVCGGNLAFCAEGSAGKLRLLVANFAGRGRFVCCRDEVLSSIGTASRGESARAAKISASVGPDVPGSRLGGDVGTSQEGLVG